METAAQAPDRPDHDFAASSLRHLVAQAKDLNLTQEQMAKINEIVVHYNQIRNRQEATYKQSEMEALKLIHDNHSSLTAIEGAVQKSDQEHSKLRMAGIKAVREATDVLRPEQYANWRQNHASRQLAAGKHDGEPATSGEKDRVAPH
jgi:Spy/CpxP family protein refolding chaperone